MVSIGGLPAEVTGVRPSSTAPQAWEVIAVVPDGDSGDGVAVRIAAAGQLSPPVTMSVR
jgi:hypothetical protein